MMRRPVGRWAGVIGVSLVLAGCAAAPTMDATGCSNVQGVIGTEFHISARAKADAPGAGAEGGINLFVGPAPMSQQLRDVLIMADELCHAEARTPPLIHQGAYDEYMSKALGGLGAEAVKAGALTSDGAKTAQRRSSNAVASVSGDGVGKLTPGQISERAATSSSAPDTALPQALAYGAQLKITVRLDHKWIIDFGGGEVDLEPLKSRLTLLENDVAGLKRIPHPAESEALGFVTFDFGSAELDNRARNEIGAMLESAPQVPLRLEAYADTVGSYRPNAELTARRAKAVADYIHVLEKGRAVTEVALGRTDAFGEATEENRRVVVRTAPTPSR